MTSSPSASGGTTYLSGVRTWVPKGPPRGPRVPESQQSPEERELRKAVEQLVGQTFFAPMLRQMRESPFANETSKAMTGGRGGEAFASLFDQKIVERISGGAGGRSLVDAAVRKYRRAADIPAAPAAPVPASLPDLKA